MGRKFLKDETYFVGHFKDGIVDGQGKLIKPNGFSYDGNWVNNLPDGKGTEVWPDQTSYMG